MRFHDCMHLGWWLFEEGDIMSDKISNKKAETMKEWREVQGKGIFYDDLSKFMIFITNLRPAIAGRLTVALIKRVIK